MMNRNQFSLTDSTNESITFSSGKYHACYYCGPDKLVIKIWRHMNKFHSNESEVIRIKHAKTADERYKELTKLRLLGDYNHNMKVTSKGEGELLVVRKAIKSNAADYRPCTGCLGFFVCCNISDHMKECDMVERNNVNKKSEVNSQTINEPLSNPKTKQMVNEEKNQKEVCNLTPSPNSKIIEEDNEYHRNSLSPDPMSDMLIDQGKKRIFPSDIKSKNLANENKNFRDDVNNMPLNLKTTNIAIKKMKPNEINLPSDPKFNEIVMSKMKRDEITDTCRNDSLIVKFGHGLFLKKGSGGCYDVKQKMRQMGRLLMQLRKDSKSTNSFSEFLSCENFDVIIEATKRVCASYMDKDCMIRRPDKPNLALSIGIGVKKCATIKLGVAIRNQDAKIKEEAQNYLELHAIDWENRISSVALSTLYSRRSAKPYNLPLAEDINAIRDFLLAQIPLTTAALKAKKSAINFRRLAEMTLVRIIIFNRRRSGEASRMLLTDYTHRPKWSDAYNTEIASAMSELERHLCTKYVLKSRKNYSLLSSFRT